MPFNGVTIYDLLSENDSEFQGMDESQQASFLSDKGKALGRLESTGLLDGLDQDKKRYILDRLYEDESVLSSIPKATARGLLRIPQAIGGGVRMIEENLTGTESGRTANDFYRNWASEYAPVSNQGPNGGIIDQVVENVSAQAPSMLFGGAIAKALGLGATAAEGIALGLMGSQATGTSYPEYRDRQEAGKLPGGPLRAGVGAVGSGIVEAATELLPTHYLMKEDGGVVSRILKSALTDVPGEELSNVGQEGIERNILGKPTSEYQSYWKQLFDPNTAKVSIGSSILMGAGSHIINGTVKTKQGKKSHSDIMKEIQGMIESGATPEEISAKTTEYINSDDIPGETKAALNTLRITSKPLTDAVSKEQKQEDLAAAIFSRETKTAEEELKAIVNPKARESRIGKLQERLSKGEDIVSILQDFLGATTNYRNKAVFESAINKIKYLREKGQELISQGERKALPAPVEPGVMNEEPAGEFSQTQTPYTLNTGLPDPNRAPPNLWGESPESNEGAPGFENVPYLPGEEIPSDPTSFIRRLIETRQKPPEQSEQQPREEDELASLTAPEDIAPPAVEDYSPSIIGPLVGNESPNRGMNLTDRPLNAIARDILEGRAAPSQPSSQMQMNQPRGEMAIPQPEMKPVESEASQGEPESSPSPTTITISKDDVPYNLALAAHSGTSYSPEQRARSRQKEYVDHMNSLVSELSDKADTPEKQAILEEELPRYKEGFLKRYKAMLAADSKIVSVMIAGPANFPNERNRKANDVADKRRQEFIEWEKKASDSIRRKISGNAPISSDSETAVDDLSKKIQKLEAMQKTMVEANKIIKKKGATQEEIIKNLSALGIDEGSARKLLTPNYMGNVGFEPYQLTNNNANIKRLKDRVSTIETRRAQESSERTFEGGKVIDNVEENRLQIIFDGKPDFEVRKRMKENGFKWAPSKGAWQRMRGPNSFLAAERSLGGIGTLQETVKAKEEQKPTEEPKPPVQVQEKELPTQPETKPVETEKKKLPEFTEVSSNTGKKHLVKTEDLNNPEKKLLKVYDKNYRETKDRIPLHRDNIVADPAKQTTVAAQKRSATIRGPRAWDHNGHILFYDTDVKPTAKEYGTIREAPNTEETITKDISKSTNEVPIPKKLPNAPSFNQYYVTDGVNAAIVMTSKEVGQAQSVMGITDKIPSPDYVVDVDLLKRTGKVIGSNIVTGLGKNKSMISVSGEKGKAVVMALNKEGRDIVSKVFSSLKIKPGDESGPMFARFSKQESSSRPATALNDKEFNSIVKSLLVGPAMQRDLIIVKDFAALPKEIQNYAKSQGASPEDIPSVYHRGKVYLVQNNLHSQLEVERALFHEFYGHYGLRAIFKDDTLKSLRELYQKIGGKDGLLALAKKYEIDLSDYERGNTLAGISTATAEGIIADELLSHIASKGDKGIIQKAKEFIGAVRQWFRNTGFFKLAEFGDTDIAYILKQARDAVEAGKSTVTGGTALMMYPAAPPPTNAFVGRQTATATVAPQTIQTIFDISQPELVELSEALNNGKHPSIVKNIRAAGGMARGVFYSNPNNSRIELRADIFKDPKEATRTFAHELAHNADFLPDKVMSRGNMLGRLAKLIKFTKNELVGIIGTNKEIRAEAIDYSKQIKPYDPQTDPPSFVKYRESSVELYADAVSGIFIDPAEAKDKMPKLFKAFFDYLGKNPKLQDAYRDVQELYSLGSDAVISHQMENLKAQNERGELANQKARAEERKTLGDFWTEIKKQFIDKNSVVYDLVKKAKGNLLSDPSLNPVLALEEMAFSSGEISSWLTDVAQLQKGLKESGVEWETLGRKLFFERIIHGDRAGLANPLGHNPESAKKALELMEALLPAKQKEALQKAADGFRENWKYIQEKLRDSGVLPEAVMDKLESNPYYATFQVIGWLEKKFPGDGKSTISSRIMRQLGTFSSITNPATATVEKGISIIRMVNETLAKKELVTFLTQEQAMKTLPADSIREAKYLFDQNTKRNIPQAPEDPKLGLIQFLQDGKLKGYYVEKGVAEIFERNPMEGKLLIRGLNFMNRIFKSLFITYNPGFMLFNIIRDYSQNVKQLAGATFTKLFPHYLKTAKNAWANAEGFQDELVQHMQKNKMLLTPEQRHLADPEDQQIDYLVKRFQAERGGIRRSWKNLYGLNLKISEFFGILDLMRFSGTMTENWSKLAGFSYLKEKFPGMNIREMAYRVRNQVGTPNSMRKGSLYPVYNNLWLFSNIFKEGARTSIEIAKDRPLEFAMKTFAYNILPKMALMGLAASGDDWKKWFDGVPLYDLVQYNIIPMGMEGEKSVYLRIPQDEAGRFIGGLFMQAMNMKKAGDMAKVFDFGAGQMPNESPALGFMTEWGQYLAGHNPYDNFRQDTVLDDRQFKAGGMEALSGMLKHSWNNLGGSLFYRFNKGENLSPKGLIENVSGTPVISNIIGRFVKVSDRGIQEKIRREAESIDEAGAKESLVEDRALVNMLKENPEATWSSAREIFDTLEESGDISTEGPGEKKRKLTTFKNKFQKMKEKGIADPRERALNMLPKWQRKQLEQETTAEE